LTYTLILVPDLLSIKKVKRSRGRGVERSRGQGGERDFV